MKKINILQMVESIKSLLNLKGTHVQGNDIDEEVIIEGFLSGYNLTVIVHNDHKDYFDRVITAQNLRSKGLKYTEIASILGVAYSTVHRYCHIDINKFDHSNNENPSHDNIEEEALLNKPTE